MPIKIDTLAKKKFRINALHGSGESIDLEIMAIDRQDAMRQVKEKGYVLYSLEESIGKKEAKRNNFSWAMALIDNSKEWLILSVLLIVGLVSGINYFFQPLGSNNKQRIITAEKLEEKNGFFYLPNEEFTFTGTHQKFYSTGGLKAEVNYQNGQLSGLARDWYENGDKKTETNYKKGQLNGLSISWVKNKRILQISYKENKLEGLAVGWYENGQKKQEETYKIGLLNGKQTQWNSAGIKVSEVSYFDGKASGITTIWDDSGKIVAEGYVRDGKIHLAYNRIIKNITKLWLMNHTPSLSNEFLERRRIDDLNKQTIKLNTDLLKSVPIYGRIKVSSVKKNTQGHIVIEAKNISSISFGSTTTFFAKNKNVQKQLKSLNTPATIAIFGKYIGNNYKLLSKDDDYQLTVEITDVKLVDTIKRNKTDFEPKIIESNFEKTMNSMSYDNRVKVWSEQFDRNNSWVRLHTLPSDSESEANLKLVMARLREN